MMACYKLYLTSPLESLVSKESNKSLKQDDEREYIFRDKNRADMTYHMLYSDSPSL